MPAHPVRAPGHPAPVKRYPALRALVALVLLGFCAVVILLLNREQVGVYLLQRAERFGGQALAGPDAADPRQIKGAIARLRDVNRFAGGTRSAAKARAYLGRLYMATGRFRQARAALEPLCKLAPADSEACMLSRIYISRCYEAEGNWDAAVKTCRDMERLHPWTTYWLEAPVYVAQVYERQGNAEQAAAAYRRAKDLSLSRLRDTLDQTALDVLRWQLGQIHERLGEWREAAAVYEFALTTDNRHDMRQRADTWYALARVLERERQYQKARSAYKALLSEFPKDSRVPEVREVLKQLP